MTAAQLTETPVTLSLHDMLQRQQQQLLQHLQQQAQQAQQQQQLKNPTSDEEGPCPSRRSFHPHHAQSVPKSENLEAQASELANKGRSVTTMMLRNIPNKYTQNTLLQEIDDLGFSGTYDFFYLPMDMHNRSNVGYAFINFMKPADATRFHEVFSEHRFQRFQSRKISSVCTAHVQGLMENLRHFENRAVTHARNDQYRPIILRNHCRVDFEDAIAELHLQQQQKPQQLKQQQHHQSAGKDERRHHSSAVAAATAKVKQLKEEADDSSFGGARQGLEDAIRGLLTSAATRTPGHEGSGMDTPGLGTNDFSFERQMSPLDAAFERQISPPDAGPAYVNLPRGVAAELFMEGWGKTGGMHHHGRGLFGDNLGAARRADPWGAV